MFRSRINTLQKKKISAHNRGLACLHAGAGARSCSLFACLPFSMATNDTTGDDDGEQQRTFVGRPSQSQSGAAPLPALPHAAGIQALHHKPVQPNKIGCFSWFLTVSNSKMGHHAFDDDTRTHAADDPDHQSSQFSPVNTIVLAISLTNPIESNPIQSKNRRLAVWAAPRARAVSNGWQVVNE